MHVTFLKLGEINTLKEQFDADILVRSKWREPQLDNFKPEVRSLSSEVKLLFCGFFFLLSYFLLGFIGSSFGRSERHFALGSTGPVFDHLLNMNARSVS